MPGNRNINLEERERESNTERVIEREEAFTVVEPHNPPYRPRTSAILEKSKGLCIIVCFSFQGALNILMILVWKRLGCLCGPPRLHCGASEPAKRYCKQTPLHYPVRIILHNNLLSFQYMYIVFMLCQKVEGNANTQPALIHLSVGRIWRLKTHFHFPKWDNTDRSEVPLEQSSVKRSQCKCV